MYELHSFFTVFQSAERSAQQYVFVSCVHGVLFAPLWHILLDFHRSFTLVDVGTKVVKRSKVKVTA